jgi:ABC-2 type transport system ATP-binding protein
MSHHENAISVERLVRNYGHVKALCGLSLRVQQGEIFGLLGANGAGKSTLIKILIGALKPTDGAVQVYGLDPTTQRHELRSSVGYMPQSPALYEDLSARENLRFFARAHRIDDLEGRIDATLDFVDLRERERDPVYGFSGGMKQRLSLACALVHNPRLLLLDEPSTGVDPRLRESFWQHFRQLAEQGVTIVVSTHQMDEALHCDRVAVLRAGDLLACDSPRGLLGRGQMTVTVWRDGRPQQHELAGAADLPRALGLGDDVERVDIHQDTLEDVVLDLIHEKR